LERREGVTKGAGRLPDAGIGGLVAGIDQARSLSGGAAVAWTPRQALVGCTLIKELDGEANVLPIGQLDHEPIRRAPLKSSEGELPVRQARVFERSPHKIAKSLEPIPLDLSPVQRSPPV
jgi:hypothetical protein